MPTKFFPRKRKSESYESSSSKKTKIQKVIKPLSKWNLNHPPSYAKERKFWDTTIATNLFYTIGGVAPVEQSLVNGIIAGTDYKQRVGRAIDVRTIQVKLLFTTANSNTFFGAARILIWVDKNGNNTDRTVGEVLDVPGTIGDMSALRNMTQHDDFVVLLDDTLPLSYWTDNSVVYEKYLRVNIPLRYTGTVASYPDNNIHVAIFSSNSSTDTKPLVNGFIRVMYEDN